jgi:hypothetical protein
MVKKEKTLNILYYAALIALIAVSFRYYSPCTFFYFNSDEAIHVLMAEDFQLPRDFYYWGQYRLGSLLPMLAYLLGKVLPLHELVLCSIVDYLFLLTAFLVLASQMKSRVLKLALCSLIFFPLGQYHALLYVGHPYSSQVFAGALFVFFLALLRIFLLRHPLLNGGDLLKAILLGFAASIFFVTGIWVSEFNALLILFPLVFLLSDQQLKAVVVNGFRKTRFLIFFVLSSLLFLLLTLSYFWMKQEYFLDPEYQKFYIDTLRGIIKNFNFFLGKVEVSYLFKDDAITANQFNWFLLLLTSALIVIRLVKGKRASSGNRPLVRAVFVLVIVSCLLLFLSSWNLRSEFSTRYFTPVYLIFCYMLLLKCESKFFGKWFRAIISGCFIFFGFSYLYYTILVTDHPTPFEKDGEFRNLPQGTMIGNYWEVYRINAVAIDNLQSLAVDWQHYRIKEWKHIPLSETNFYFLQGDWDIPGGLTDTIAQHGLLFKNSGKKYTCNGREVLLYHKIGKVPEQ